MSSSKEENLAIPVESIENENQTLLPQTDILDGSTDGKTGNSSTSQTNNGTYDEKSKANETSNSGKYPVITKSSKAKEAGETIGRSKCCTCKRCAISCGIISGIVVLILIVGAVMWKQRKDAANEKIEEFQAGSEEWEKKLEGISEASNLSMSGTYELKGYDTKYEDYMKAFGIPVIILSFIIGTPETIVFTEPQEGDSIYTLKTITGDNVRIKEHKFELDKDHETEYNQGKGIMKTVCSIPVTNVLECRQEEETKGWKITNRYEFDLLGIKNIKTFHTKDIVAKKYYERIGANISDKESSSEIELESDMIKIEKSNDTNVENPFGNYDWEDGGEDEW